MRFPPATHPVLPFATEAAIYVAEFDPRPPAQCSQEGLFDLLDRNRELLMAVLSAEAFETEVVDADHASPLKPAVHNLERLLDADIDLNGFKHIDAYVTARLCFAIVLGLTFFYQWLFRGLQTPAGSDRARPGDAGADRPRTRGTGPTRRRPSRPSRRGGRATRADLAGPVLIRR